MLTTDRLIEVLGMNGHIMFSPKSYEDSRFIHQLKALMILIMSVLYRRWQLANNDDDLHTKGRVIVYNKRQGITSPPCSSIFRSKFNSIHTEVFSSTTVVTDDRSETHDYNISVNLHVRSHLTPSHLTINRALQYDSCALVGPISR